MRWLCEAVGDDDLAIDKADGPPWNIVGAEEFTRRVVKNWVVLKGKRERATIDLG
jgi:hypothetical protein